MILDKKWGADINLSPFYLPGTPLHYFPLRFVDENSKKSSFSTMDDFFLLYTYIIHVNESSAGSSICSEQVYEMQEILGLDLYTCTSQEQTKSHLGHEAHVKHYDLVSYYRL